MAPAGGFFKKKFTLNSSRRFGLRPPIQGKGPGLIQPTLTDALYDARKAQARSKHSQSELRPMATPSQASTLRLSLNFIEFDHFPWPLSRLIERQNRRCRRFLGLPPP